MKSHYIWIIIFLMLVIAGMFLFWPEPVDNTAQHQREIARKDSVIHSLNQEQNRIAQKIAADSLQQAKDRQAYKEDVGKLESLISDLKRNARVDTVLRENPEVAALVEAQDSLIQRQATRIDSLELNLADLRLDARKITANFEAQIEALGSIREAQTQIISQQEREIRKHKREKRLAIIGGIAGVVAVLILK